MADSKKGPEEEFSYKYYILGNTTPVRVAHDAENLVAGAQVPDLNEPGGFRWSMAHLTRIEQSEEVEEVSRDRFKEATRTYLDKEIQKKRPVTELRL